MKKISRIFLFGALTLVVLSAACAEATPTTIATSGPIGRLASPTPLGTDMAGTPVASPAGTATTETAATEDPNTTGTSAVPVTGGDLIALACQYCIERMAHALLILPGTVTFGAIAEQTSRSTAGQDTGCNTVDRFRDRQVVLCRAKENTSLILSICSNSSNCTQLLVELQSCPMSNPSEATNTPEADAPSGATVDITGTPGAAPTTPTP